ncbi:MAG TPA: hypothetical protein VMP01_05790 [Pirellulaceae bacterium]|nr:hypothetical protein [Pirellulaceae bacterium]
MRATRAHVNLTVMRQKQQRMVVPLDSPRWNVLRHAYGQAGDTPDLIRAIRSESNPNYHDGGAWFAVYSSLFHQHSVYSATYAAMPHLVQIGETGAIAQRVAVMCLAGEILVFGCADEPIPDDLLPGFESALDAVKRSSLKTVREAAGAGSMDRTGIDWNRGGLLLAFGGLRYPKSGFVVQLDYIVREAWRAEAECPACGETMLAKWRAEGLATSKINEHGYDEPQSANVTCVDRSCYSGLIERGQRLLESEHSDWALPDTPSVLAALAFECGERLLGTTILDLGTTVTCPYCAHRFELSSGLRPL